MLYAAKYIISELYFINSTQALLFLSIDFNAHENVGRLIINTNEKIV